MFANGETIPDEFSRPEVVAVLQAYYAELEKHRNEHPRVDGVRTL
jgi:ATP sulfurylase